MIPRVRPSYSLADLGAALRAGPHSLRDFEAALASHFDKRHALLFPYGRSAIYSCLRAMGLEGSEVLQPAYNCVVVAHATVMAGCQPRFVDTLPDSPNQDPAAMIEQVGPQTGAVIPTSIFGVPFDAPTLVEEIRRRNPRALILIDSCQAFDATWQGQRLSDVGDAALLAFGIGKPITALYGGALLTDRDDLAQAVRTYQETHFRRAGTSSIVQRWFYFLASWLALSGPMVGLTDWLEHTDTPLRRYLLTLRSREAIRLPADNEVTMRPLEAAVGLSQLRRVEYFLARRRAIGQRYNEVVARLPGLQPTAWGEGASYAIYALRVREPAQRLRLLAALRQAGVQGDTVLSYVVPALACYSERGHAPQDFPQAQAWAETVVNLPNHPTMGEGQVRQVIEALQRLMQGQKEHR